MAFVANFIPRMARRWEIIGLQLRQDVLVRNLKLVPTYNAESFCTDVIGAAMEAGCLRTYGKLLRILEKPSVRLAKVASDLREDLLEESRKKRTATDSQELSVSGKSINS